MSCPTLASVTCGSITSCLETDELRHFWRLGGRCSDGTTSSNVNGFFAREFQLLSYDASGYGRSTAPLENYSVEAWADEAAGLLEQLHLPRVFVLGTSMGGMIAFALTAKRPDLVRATCADCTFLRPDMTRRMLLRSWRHMIEAMPLDSFCDLLTLQSVNPAISMTSPARRRDARHRRHELAVHLAPVVPRAGGHGP